MENQVHLHLVDGGAGDGDRTANGVIVDPGGPAVSIGPLRAASSSTTRDSTSISRVAVTFNGQVTPPRDPVAAKRGLRQDPVKHVRLFATVVNGRTVAELDFPRRWFPGGSLRDGSYLVVVRGDRARDRSGRTLDGDADGVEGGVFTAAFRRRFGDGNGDGVVDRNDRPLFRRALAKRTGQPGFAWYFDARSDGRVGIADLARFSRRSSDPVGSSHWSPTDSDPCQ